jgi:type II secretory pathway pseudopilin PulG
VKRFSFKDEAGLTLAEILVAMAVIMIGLVALMQAFPLGTQGIDTGRRQSTGVFLAEQKIEQIKAFSLSTAPLQGFALVPICNPCNGAAPFNQENFNTIVGYPEYSRTVIVQGLPQAPTANTKLVRVTLSYRRATSTGVFTGGTQVSVETLIAQH